MQCKLLFRLNTRSCITYTALYPTHCTLHTTHCLYLKLTNQHSTLHFTLDFTLHFTLHTPQSTLDIPHSTLHIWQSTLHTSHSTLDSPHCICRPQGILQEKRGLTPLTVPAWLPPPLPHGAVCSIHCAVCSIHYAVCKFFQRLRKIRVFERKNTQLTTVLPFLGNF